MTQQKVVIVGGGYLGTELARALDAAARVTLVEPRDAFVQPPAAIRALVQPGLLDQIILPYDRLLARGQVVQARVAEVTGSGVTLCDGRALAADIVVVATGSSYAAPFKPAGDSIAAFRAAHEQVSAQLAAAGSVAIVGAGAVGTELAGEIAAAQPGKSITLISSDDRLFPAYPARLGRQLQAKLARQGVQVILGQRAQDLRYTDRPYQGAVTLTDGRVITADLVFPVIGARAQTDLLSGLPGARTSAAGRVAVDGWLRPSDLPNVFAAGDIIDAGDGMTIVAITRQAPWLAKTLKRVLAGAPLTAQRRYTPWRQAPILLPLGPHLGNSWLFVPVGDWLTRQIKGKHLFIPKNRKAFGLPKPGKAASPAESPR